MSPRLALRISRRWARLAPILRLYHDARTLEISRTEFSRLWTGLLRGGLDSRKIDRLDLGAALRLSNTDRQKWMQQILEEKNNER